MKELPCLNERDDGPQRFWSLLVAVSIVYIPFGAVFGATATSMGRSWGEAVGLSLLMFAASAQFAIVNPIILFDLQAAVLTTLAINVRHLIYGPSLPSEGVPVHFGARALFAFCLTDEVYASVVALNPADVKSVECKARRSRWSVMFGLFAYVIWVSSTAIGAALARVVHFEPKWFSHVPFVVFVAITYETIRTAKPEARVIGVIAAMTSCAMTIALGIGLSFAITIAFVVTIATERLLSLCGKP